MLHQLNLQVLVCLIVVGQQVIDALKKGRQSAAIVLLLQQELFLRKYLHQVNEAITGYSAKTLRVGSQVGNDSHDGLVDRFEEAWA